MDKKNKHPYAETVSFAATVLKSEPFADQSFIAKASVEALEPLIKGTKIDLHDNIDLLGVAFNVAVANMFNHNDDVVGPETAALIQSRFVHKPANLEHKDFKVVGHTTNAGMNTFSDESPLSAEVARKLDDPFNLSLAGIVYRSVVPEFAEILQRAADPDDVYFEAISTSWELGFSDFYIAVGDGKFLRDVDTITDAEQIAALKSCLKAYGGNGYSPEGQRLRRIITGDVYPIGLAFTTNPAARVKGVFVSMPWEEDLEAKKISQSSNTTVTNKNKPTMDINEIIQTLKASLEKGEFNDKAIASMTSTFKTSLEDANKQYKEDLAAAEKRVADADKKFADLEEASAATIQKLEKAEADLKELQDARAKAEADELFQSRIGEIDEAFELGDEDRKVICDELKNVGDEEAYASYRERLNVLLSSKSKASNEEAQKAQQKAIDDGVAAKLKEIAKAKKSDDDNTDDDDEGGIKAALKALREKAEGKASFPNSISDEDRNGLQSKFSKAFSEDGISVS